MDADEVLKIGASARHQPVRRHRHQKTESLDVAEHMNGLALAIGEVDLLPGRHGLAHEQDRVQRSDRGIAAIPLLAKRMQFIVCAQKRCK